MSPSPNLFAGLWAAWGLVWLVAALRTSRTVSAQSVRSRFLHLGLFGLGGALVFVHFDAPRALAFQLLPFDSASAWVGLAFVVIGLGFAICARLYLGRLWSGTVTLKESHTLIRSGPYRVTRHPIYTGLIAALFGTAMANGTLAAALGFGLLFLAFGLKLRLEEKVLREHFGERYDEYCKEVPTLVPFVW